MGVDNTYNVDPPRHPLVDSLLGFVYQAQLWWPTPISPIEKGAWKSQLKLEERLSPNSIWTPPRMPDSSAEAIHACVYEVCSPTNIN